MKVQRYFDFKSILSHYIRPGGKTRHRKAEKCITNSENIFSPLCPYEMKYKYKKQKQKTKQNNHTDITKLKYLIHFSSNLFELHANN
jgi:hypothetical protein